MAQTLRPRRHDRRAGSGDVHVHVVAVQQDVLVAGPSGRVAMRVVTVTSLGSDAPGAPSPAVWIVPQAGVSDTYVICALILTDAASERQQD